MKTSFWSPEAKQLLVSYGRQDLVDRGEALAQRVTALMLSATNRLESWSKDGNLYNGMGGLSDMNHPNVVGVLENFVNVRLRAEIDALENIMCVFDDLKSISSSPVESKEVTIEVW